MKKAITIALSLVFTLGAFVFAQTAYAATYNWTDGYYDFLSEEIPNINLGKNNFTQFALYDINGDNIPELILKNTKLDGSYKIYNYSNSQVNFEKTLSASSLYLTEEGQFVVEYGEVAGTTYIYYDAEKSLATSDQMLKSSRIKQTGPESWDWTYTYHRKYIEKEEFDALVKEKLVSIPLVYSDINEKNLAEEILLGCNYPGNTNVISYSGQKENNGNDVTLKFANNNTVLSRENGVDNLYGLLMIEGIIATDIYPINIDGTTLVPVRVVSEGLNASVEWVASLQKINIKKSGVSIELYIDEDYAIVNGERVFLNVPATIINGSTYVPVRFVTENLDCDVCFEGGEDNFLPIINVTKRNSTIANLISDSEAMGKAKYLMKNINWTADKNVFARNFMDKNVSVKYEGEYLNKYHVISVDVNGTQKMLIDKATGHVFSMYSYNNSFGIEPGTAAIVEAMLVVYTR